jgi:hypothetical protein
MAASNKRANRLFQQTGEALASSSSSPAAKKVAKLCLEAEELDAAIRQTANVIKTKDLPEALSALGTSVWKSDNGHYAVEIKPFVSGTLPKADKDAAKRKKAIAWIVANGGAAIVKTEIGLSFGKQDRAQAERVLRSLSKAGFEPDVNEGVHPQTLLAFVREKLEGGEQVDLDTLGLFSGRTAKLTIVDLDKPKKR